MDCGTVEDLAYLYKHSSRMLNQKMGIGFHRKLFSTTCMLNPWTRHMEISDVTSNKPRHIGRYDLKVVTKWGGGNR